MKLVKLAPFLTLVSLLLALPGCGGGGGDSTPAAPPAAPTFPLQAGHRALLASASTDNFIISGWCEGTAAITNAAATSATFEGVAGFQVLTSGTITLAACDAAGTYSGQITRYFDANYSPIGSVDPEGEFRSSPSAPAALPTSVKVGDTAEYAVLTEYADSTKATITGRARLSYLVEPDSATTARLILIEDSYSPSNQHLFRDRATYRIARNGTLTLISTDTYSYLADAYLLYTKI
ncbi:MAG: hypothetical protein H7Y33_02850 [Cytophagales bacterium]|nr:hypothetical protein [Rhizobacter sp.]